MISDPLLNKAQNLSKEDKARAWDYLIGYQFMHAIKCVDIGCRLCGGIVGSVEFVEEYPTEKA